MICADIYGPKDPFPIFANLTNCLLGRRSSLGIEFYRFVPKPRRVVFAPIHIRRDPRTTVLIMKAVNGTALITVKPRSVGTKSNQICERNIGVVPHCHKFTGEEPTRLRRRF